MLHLVSCLLCRNSSWESILLSQIAVIPRGEGYISKPSGAGKGRGGIVSGTSRGFFPISRPLTSARENALAILMDVSNTFDLQQEK